MLATLKFYHYLSNKARFVISIKKNYRIFATDNS